ncbi:MAG TPA: zinc-binding dehydrogenase [Gaiellaceae bacterium]|nr:zinc-binding dehydrogenase [Gaiellaceae bacterium]
MRAVVFTGAGGADVMQLDERPDPAPSADEVLVAVRFAGLNGADLAQRAGNYPAPPGSPADIPGIEVAGTVAAVGSNVRGLAEGDRVFGLVGGGGLADRVLAHERHLTRVPDSLSDEEAAAAPEAFVTAHDAISTQAQLRLGDVLLVNGANGGVGSAAVQIGVVAGARVFASARSAHDRLAELGAEPVAPDEAFERVKAAGGADVVLELLGAPNIPADLDALATWGRVIVIGTGLGADASVSLRALMARRGRILASTLRARPIEEKAAAVQAFAHGVVPALASGAMRAIVDRVFPAEEAPEAFDRMAASGKFGKVLLAF